MVFALVAFVVVYLTIGAMVAIVGGDRVAEKFMYSQEPGSAAERLGLYKAIGLFVVWPLTLVAFVVYGIRWIILDFIQTLTKARNEKQDLR